MDDKNIPYIAFEAEMARHEREKLRLIKALVVAILIILISNIAWLAFFNQFEFEAQTVQQELDSGNANFIGNNGAITNGRADSNNN